MYKKHVEQTSQSVCKGAGVKLGLKAGRSEATHTEVTQQAASVGDFAF